MRGEDGQVYHYAKPRGVALSGYSFPRQELTATCCSQKVYLVASTSRPRHRQSIDRNPLIGESRSGFTAALAVIAQAGSP